MIARVSFRSRDGGRYYGHEISCVYEKNIPTGCGHVAGGREELLVWYTPYTVLQNIEPTPPKAAA